MTDEPTGPVRAFVGAPLDGALRDGVLRLQERLRRGLVDERAVRWEPASNLHVTLVFLGETDRILLNEVRSAVADATAGRRTVDAALGPPGRFPDRGAPRVLVVPVEDGSGELARIRAELVRRLEPLGFPAERRPFRPHATVGRVRRNRSLAAAAADLACASASATAACGGGEIARVVLFQSVLGPTGASYRPILESVLTGP